MLKHKSPLGWVFCFCFFLFLLKIPSIVLSGTLPWRETVAASPRPSLSDLGHLEEAMVLPVNSVPTAVHHKRGKPISPPEDFGLYFTGALSPEELQGSLKSLLSQDENSSDTELSRRRHEGLWMKVWRSTFHRITLTLFSLWVPWVLCMQSGVALWFSRTTGYSVYGIISQHKLYYQGALTFEWKSTTQMILWVLLTPIDVFRKVQCQCQGKGEKCLLIIILCCSCLLLRADLFFQSSTHFTLYILMLY